MFRQIFGTREIPVHITLTILMVISHPSQSLPTTLKNIVTIFTASVTTEHFCFILSSAAQFSRPKCTYLIE